MQPTHTYVYHDGGEVVETVILKDGDTVVAPASPNRAGKRFDGWCEDEALARLFAGFGGEAAGDGGTTHLYAKFTDVHYFTYYDESGKVIECELVELGQSYTFYAQSPQFTLASDTARNDGWRAADGTVYGEADAYPGGQTITVSGDLDLRPVPQEGFYAHFHSQGGSATVSQFIHEGGKVTRPADPTRQGYAFAGWYDAPEGGAAFDFGHAYTTVPSDSVEVYAHWTPQNVTYHVSVWLENADDVTYTYDEANSYDATGLVGSEAFPSTIANIGGYHFNAGANADYDSTHEAKPEIIAGDGSTTVNLYYRRDSWIVNFLVDGAVIASFDGHDEEHPRIKWGQNIEQLWWNDSAVAAASEPTGAYSYMWAQSWVGNRQVTKYFYDAMGNEPIGRNGETVTVSRISRNGPYYAYKIYSETLDAGGETFLAEDGRYYDSAPLEWGYYFPSAHDTIVPRNREGFTLAYVKGATNGSDPSKVSAFRWDENSRKMEWYYSRNSYSVTFVPNDGTSSRTVVNGVKYEQVISDADGIDAARAGFTEASVLPDGRHFVYWSDSPDGDKFDFSRTMPNSGVVLYGVWRESVYSVEYDPMGGTMQDDLVQTVRYGQRLEEPAEPVRHGYRFVDWHLADGSDPDDMGQPYVFGSPVTDDMTLRAHWVSDTAHTIVYKPGEGSGSVPSIGTYLPGSTGRAQSGDALVPPAGKHFSYWLSADGVRYYPGELVSVANSDVVLTAQYSPADLTGLLYDLNYSRFGIAAPVPDQVVAGASGLLVNSTVRLRDPAASEVPEGWAFAGWYLDAGCAGEPLSEVMVDADAPLPNVVYAKWAKKPAPGGAAADDEPPEPEEPAPAATAEPQAPTATGAAAASPRTGDALSIAGLAALALCSLCVAVACRPRAARPQPRHARR